MEEKKTTKADLENKKGLFVQFGLVFTLLLMLVAFNWKSYGKEDVKIAQTDTQELIQETIIQTQVDDAPPEPTPPDEIIPMDLPPEIVEDSVTLTREYTPVDAGADQGTAQQNYNLPPPPPPGPTESEEDEKEIFIAVEKMPEYPGGETSLMTYLQENIKYPQLAKETNVQGIVYVTFVVEKDGKVSDVKLLRDIGAGCGTEAIRVVKSMKGWAPGEQRGKKVRVQYNLPVRFGLN